MKIKQSVLAVGPLGLSTPKSETGLTFGAFLAVCGSLWLSNTVIRNASHGRVSLTTKLCQYQCTRENQYCQDYASVVT
jgi:hypothetical protein